MHELSIAQSILDMVKQNVPKENNTQVKSVKVRVGKLSNVLPDSLLFCFEAITKDTAFDKTKLIINNIPLILECKDCGKLSEITDFAFPVLFAVARALV